MTSPLDLTPLVTDFRYEIAWHGGPGSISASGYTDDTALVDDLFRSQPTTRDFRLTIAGQDYEFKGLVRSVELGCPSKFEVESCGPVYAAGGVVGGKSADYIVADEMARWEKAYPLNDDGSLAASTVGNVDLKTVPITFETVKAAYDKLNDQEDTRMASNYGSYNISFDPAVTASAGTTAYINLDFPKETPVNESCPICGAPRVAHETYQRLTKKGVSKTYEQHIYECGTVKFSGDVPKNHYGSRVEIACASIY